jgi:hypothetical protein
LQAALFWVAFLVWGLFWVFVEVGKGAKRH